MTVNITLTSMLLVLFVIHTIFTHLFNWAIRSNNYNTIGIGILGSILEIAIVIIIIVNVTA